MVTENAILNLWRERKFSGRNFHRLIEPHTLDQEFRGQLGHPSSYAYVQFECSPGDQLNFESRASWPKSLTPEYVHKVEAAIVEGIVDGVSTSIYPYRGCRFVLAAIKWDDIGGSEAAFHLATMRAMKQLIDEAKWKLVVVPP